MYLDNPLIKTNSLAKRYLFQELNAARTYSIKINAKDKTRNITSFISNEQTLNGIYQGDISLRTQGDLQSFGELGYIEITGNLVMDGLGVFTDINDLSPIYKIKGYVIINFMNALTSLIGLSVEHIGLGIRISRNDNLINLNGLHNLVEVFGDLEITQNYNLLTISDINNLATIGTPLNITNNLNLTKITSFDNVTSAYKITIETNRLLTKIVAFNNLIELENDLSIYNNAAVSILNSFTKL